MWKPFYFDGNNWFGMVDSPAKFKELLSAYQGYGSGLGMSDLAFLLDRAHRAPVSEIAKLPPSYHLLDPKGVRTGEIPNFGFRREHTGKQTLGEWLRENGIDLSLAVPQ